MSWRMSYQDYRNWRTTDFREPHPKVEFEDYPDREAAERAKARAISDGYTACVAPTPAPKRKSKRPVTLDEVAGTAPKRFNAGWRLHT